jgi:hypothetical protein
MLERINKFSHLDDDGRLGKVDLAVEFVAWKSAIPQLFHVLVQDINQRHLTCKKLQ